MAQWARFIDDNFIILIDFPPSGRFSSGHPEASLTRFCVKLLICAQHCFLHEHISPKVIFDVRQSVDDWQLNTCKSLDGENEF